MLLVDDDRVIATMYQAGLEARGFAVTVAANGLAAMSAVGRQRPDAIVLDWQMPVMNGEEFLARVRHDDRTAVIPVIVLSNSVTDDRVKELARSIGALWLVKARTAPDELADRLTELLRE